MSQRNQSANYQPVTFDTFLKKLLNGWMEGHQYIIYLDFLKQLTKYHIKEIKPHGIGIGIIHWIEQWLTDRRHWAVVDGKLSNWKPVLCGEGLPILFFNIHLYTIDLEEWVTSNILEFADNNTLFGHWCIVRCW